MPRASQLIAAHNHYCSHVRFADFLSLDGVEETVLLRSTVGFMAFHGGNLERTTDDIATVAADRSGASLYTVTQPHPMREHLPSTSVQPGDSVKLAAFVDHVDVAFAIHGYGREGLWSSILLGGVNRELAAILASTLRERLPDFLAVDTLDDIPVTLRGMHPENPVNKARFGGVQIELPPRVRGLTPHAARFDRTDGRIPWTDALIDSLVETAQIWTAIKASDEPSLLRQQTDE
jgi:phage replication-related protein YjqB (UPF0714/DUF867 family)